MGKERKAYGVELLIPDNFEKITTEEFAKKLQSMSGFLGIAPYRGEQSQAALFDSLSNRNKAYNELSKDMIVAIIPETAYIPV